MRKLGLGLVSAAVLFACAHAPSPTPAPSESAAVDAGAPDAGELATRTLQMATEVAAARQLALTKPVDVVVDEPEAFHRAFYGKLRRDTKRAGLHNRTVEAGWVAFGFVAPEGTVDGGVTADQVGKIASGVLDEQIAGFYDDDDHRLHLPSKPPSGMPNLPNEKAQAAVRDFLVGHELVHALQDQHFGFATLRALPLGSDAALAMHAVYEGDATLGSMIMVAKRNGLATAQTLELADQRITRSGSMEGVGEKLGSAPPIVRDRLLFPYIAGTHLAIALYQTGGLALVDQLYAHPPQTTEQLLHPEKYLAGEPAVPVAQPQAPEGKTLVTEGSLGELGVRILLQERLSPGLARVVANGWGGDHYAVFRGADGKSLTLLWSTAWDSEAAAAGFEKFLKLVTATWKEGPAPAEARSWTVDDRVTIRRSGNRVAVIRGLAPGAAETMAPALFALVGPPPVAQPPLGAIALRGPIRNGHLEPDGTYVSERLALRAPTPEGFHAVTDQPNQELTIRREEPFGSGVFIVISQPYSAQVVDQVFAGFAHGLKSGTGAPAGRKPISLSGAQGVQQTWDVGGRHTRAVVLPACKGRSSILLVSGWGDEATAARLERWEAALVPPEGAPFCTQPAP